MPRESAESRLAKVPEPREALQAAIGADDVLVGRLRAGDEGAFAEIVDGWSAMMLRVARSYVSTDASAEEIVQDTWMAVVRGVDAFEGRSSLRTWLFRILTNLAKTRGVREARTLPWSSLGPADPGAPSVDPDRFRGPDDEFPGGWTPVGSPRPWEPSPEDSALAAEIRAELSAAMARLPDRQRTVVSLRDVHGLSAEEVCEVLHLTAANQRVLLHRARSSLRGVLEDYYRGTASEVTP
jgi:RNA polymerase sigma-70 factor, ECF subfamily